MLGTAHSSLGRAEGDGRRVAKELINRVKICSSQARVAGAPWASGEVIRRYATFSYFRYPSGRIPNLSRCASALPLTTWHAPCF